MLGVRATGHATEETVVLPSAISKRPSRGRRDATGAVTFTEAHEMGGAEPKYEVGPFGKSATGSRGSFFVERRQRGTAEKIPETDDFGWLVKLSCVSPSVSRGHPLSFRDGMATAYGLRENGVPSPNELLWAALRRAVCTVTGSPRPTAYENFRRVSIDVDPGTPYGAFLRALGVPRCLACGQRNAVEAEIRPFEPDPARTGVGNRLGSSRLRSRP